MALSSVLEKLKDSLACCTYNGAQHTHILIEENDPAAALKKITLIAPTGDWFSFNPDKGRGKAALMSSLLTADHAHEHHCACDCVVAVHSNNQLTLLYLDLKSGSPRGYAAQFKSTRQFTRYVLGLLEEFHGEKLVVDDERYVILYGGKPTLLNKTPTIPKASKIGHTRPDKAYKREVTNPGRLYLKELLS